MAGRACRVMVEGMKSKKTSRAGSDAAPSPRPAHKPEQIAALAHAIWIDRGRPEGKDLDHWLEAERQLRGEVREPLAADELSANDRALDPTRSLETPVDRELDRMVAPPEHRSSTSL